jgi:hypothetical protein
MAIASVVCGATSARAATAPGLPRGAVVRVGPSVDAATFARAVALRYHVVLKRVVAADIDRDGDLDVISTTELGFFVWVNDGTGRLTSETPKRRPFIDGTAPPDTWNGGGAVDDETIQNDVPSTRLPSASAHAPPASIARSAAASDASLYSATPHACSAPRAPPFPL